MAARGEYGNELVGRGGHGGGHGHGHGGHGHRGHRGGRRGRGRRFFGGWGGWDGPWSWGPWDWYGGSPYDYGDSVDEEGFGPLIMYPPLPGYHVEARRVNYLMGAEPPSVSAFVGCDACGNPCFVAVVDGAASR